MTSAQKWRIRCTIGFDATYFGCREFMFLHTAGDSSQPGTGTAASSTPAAGSAAGAFDGNTATDFATAHGGGTGYLEFDFDSAQSISEIYYDPRTSFASQSPRHMVVESYNGSAWVTEADIPGITAWTGGTAKRFAVPYPGDEAGGHRYWRIFVTATFSGTTWSAVQVEFIDSGVSIENQYDAVVSSGGFNSPDALFDTTTSGDAIGFITSLNTYAGVDFGRKRAIQSVAITARSNGSFLTQTPKTFTIDWSDDGSSWTTLGSFNEGGGTPTANQRRTYALSSTETGDGVMAFSGISYTAQASTSGVAGAMAFSGIAFDTSATVTNYGTGILVFGGISFTAGASRVETATSSLAFRGISFQAAGYRSATLTGVMAFAGISIQASALRAPPVGSGKRGFWAFGH